MQDGILHLKWKLSYVFLALQYPGYSGKSSAVREICLRQQMMQERQQQRTLCDITYRSSTLVLLNPSLNTMHSRRYHYGIDYCLAIEHPHWTVSN